MKYIGSPIQIMALFALFITGATACNKEDLGEKMMVVDIAGYNGTGHALQVDIDTTAYDQTVGSGKYIYQPGSLISFNVAYTYRDNGQERMVTLKDPESGKVVFSKPLPVTGTAASYQFVYFDSKEQEITRPAANTNTNKLGFYVYYPQHSEPFDILLYRREAATGKEYRYTLAKDVQPGSWVYADFVAMEGFDSRRVWRETMVYFTKPGTTDQWAFQENESMSKLSAEAMLLPIAGEKGLVLPYFITPGTWGLDRVNLFFDQKRTL